MSNVPQQSSRRQFLRELAVPCVMMIAIALFICDSIHLSYEALVFPVVLVVVVLAALVWALASGLKPDKTAPELRTQRDDDEEGGPIVVATPWLLVALPAVLVASFNILGVLPALILLVFGAQAIFSLRSPVQSLLIAIAVVTPTYAVFKYVLYARFPAGVLGLG